jgi:hypothetical protein
MGDIIRMQQAIGCFQVGSRLRLARQAGIRPRGDLPAELDRPVIASLVAQFDRAPLLLRPFINGEHDDVP